MTQRMAFPIRRRLSSAAGPAFKVPGAVSRASIEAAHMRVLVNVANARAHRMRPPSTKLACADDVNRWMASPKLVDQSLSLYDRTRLWMNLRLLRGLDVEEFLEGATRSYHVVQALMRDGSWDKLEPLLHPVALTSMQELLGKQVPYAARHTQEADHITVRAAILSRAQLLEPDTDVVGSTCTCHVDVRFEALQGVTMHDIVHGPKIQGAPRLQEATWTFEGVISRRSDDKDIHHMSWRVMDMEWRVWEVEPTRPDAFPGWPTHGP